MIFYFGKKRTQITQYACVIETEIAIAGLENNLHVWISTLKTNPFDVF